MKKLLSVLLIISVAINVYLFVKLQEKQEDFTELNQMYFREEME